MQEFHVVSNPCTFLGLLALRLTEHTLSIFHYLQEANQLDEPGNATWVSCPGGYLRLYILSGWRGTNSRPRHPHRSEEHTSELQSQSNLVCRLLLEKKKNK